MIAPLSDEHRNVSGWINKDGKIISSSTAKTQHLTGLNKNESRKPRMSKYHIENIKYSHNERLSEAREGYYSRLKEALEKGFRVDGVNYLLPTPGGWEDTQVRCKNLILGAAMATVAVGLQMKEQYFGVPRNRHLMTSRISGLVGYGLHASHQSHVQYFGSHFLLDCIGWLQAPNQANNRLQFMGFTPTIQQQMYEISSRGPTFRLQLAYMIKDETIRRFVLHTVFNMTETFVDKAITHLKNIEVLSLAYKNATDKMEKEGALGPGALTHNEYQDLPNHVRTKAERSWMGIQSAFQNALFAAWVPSFFNPPTVGNYAMRSVATFVATTFLDSIWNQGITNTAAAAQHATNDLVVEEQEYDEMYESQDDDDNSQEE